MRLDGKIAGPLLALTAIAVLTPASAAPRAASGETQVIARIEGREITVSELRSEIGRLGLSLADPDAEKIALDNIINRKLLANAARTADMHRQPEAQRRIAAAQEQALADYYLAAATQPPEPSHAEIEDYVFANPDLFADRKVYGFSVLTLSTSTFEKRDFTPLFDETRDFAALKEALDRTGAGFTEATTLRAGDAFPKPIREQLGKYGLRDNIVIKGDRETQIMKITSVRAAPIAADEAPAIARRALLQAAVQTRAAALVESLKTKSEITYYRQTLAPQPRE